MGVFIFNATIDDFEEGCEDLKEHRKEEVEPTERGERTDSPAPEEPTVTMSTPIRRRAVGHEEPEESPILRKKKKVTKLNYTIEGRQEVPFEPNDRTEAKWVAKPAASLRFIDDCFSLSKVNFENSYGFKIGEVCHTE